jgi:hypothetical protein
MIILLTASDTGKCSNNIKGSESGRVRVRGEREEQMKELAPIDSIERKIFLIRGRKVMLDRDLAEL